MTLGSPVTAPGGRWWPLSGARRQHAAAPVKCVQRRPEGVGAGRGDAARSMRVTRESAGGGRGRPEGAAQHGACAVTRESAGGGVASAHPSAAPAAHRPADTHLRPTVPGLSCPAGTSPGQGQGHGHGSAGQAPLGGQGVGTQPYCPASRGPHIPLQSQGWWPCLYCHLSNGDCLLSPSSREPYPDAGPPR